ncbi:hypothetical protein CoNPh11_CDS0007 [Staphylococcus phage S-CoN_Ph11]|nr:hypothetical protein CoNPh11_CDS0007 [Staphylococcus phage S-CoN_Ph11]
MSTCLKIHFKGAFMDFSLLGYNTPKNLIKSLYMDRLPLYQRFANAFIYDLKKT